MKTIRYGLIRSAKAGEAVTPIIVFGSIKPSFYELQKNKEYIGLQLIKIDKHNRVVTNFGVIKK